MTQGDKWHQPLASKHTCMCAYECMCTYEGTCMYIYTHRDIIYREIHIYIKHKNISI